MVARRAEMPPIVRSVISALTLLVGCAGPPPTEPVTPLPPSSVAPPAPAASSAPPAASANVPPVSSWPEACRGAHVDLLAALDADCRESPTTPPPAPPGLIVSVRSPGARVPRGGTSTIEVVLRNSGTAPIVLYLETGIAESSGDAAPPGRSVTEFFVAMRDAAGHSFERPSGSLPAGVMEITDFELRAPVRIDLAPGGELVAPVRWRAVGFLPGKPYRFLPAKPPSTRPRILGPEPLPAGSYSLTIAIPLWKVDDVSVTTKITVE